ncbi:unnamed protein product [Mytilus coruscus]|uniref:Uncharacterized protein n=1 Tax=Mytilus coruscus TaxID=42192 RepID=A0A6J8DR76_MYTCO|nr:unnamed protein product [Mytilus coruscus]
MSVMNQKLENVNNTNTVLHQQLQKLDLLEDISKKLQIFEKNMREMKIEINNMKATQEQQARTLAKEENHHHIIEDRVKSMEQVNTYLENENFELKEQFLRLQKHSMKYNLIFSGIKEQENESKEDTESVIKNFIATELEIRDANTIAFQNVHRLRPRNDGKPINIIARFSQYDDHQRVLRAVPEKLKHKSCYSVQQQYPAEINERRRALVPKLKEFQRARRNARIIYDQLIVDGQPYEPPPRGVPPEQQNVHRLRPRNDGKPINIIARFSQYDDHQRVLRAVPEKLKHKSCYSVQQQYPAEINERRRALVPKLKRVSKGP